jgi:hypothetical protein
MSVHRPPRIEFTKIAFDLDGVLDHPEMSALARFLFAAGIEVHIITVGAVEGDAPEAEGVMRARKIERLDFLGVPFTTLHIVTGKDYEEAGEEKAAIVSYYGIPIIVDDSPSLVRVLVKDTTAMVLHLKAGGGTGDED